MGHNGAVLVDRGERWWRTRPEVPAPTGVVNGVLGCESVTIPPDGVVARDWGIEFGSIAVTHHGPSNDPVLVFAGGPVAADRPGGGPTTARLDARSGGSFALTGRLLTVWGTPGDSVTLQAFTGCVPPVVAATGATPDSFATYEALPDQVGAGGVLTFTFTAPVGLVVVHAVGTGQVARVSTNDQTPTAALGGRCADDAPVYLPVTTATVRVFTPAAMVVTVTGFRP